MQNFREESKHHTQNPTGEYHKLIDGSYKLFPMKQQIYEIQTNLRLDKFMTAIQNLMGIIRNQK